MASICPTTFNKRRKVASERLPAVPFSNLWMVVKPSPVSLATSFWVRLHLILYSLNLTPSKRTNSGVEYSYKSAIIFYYLSIIIMIFIPYISLYLQYTDIYGCKYNKKKWNWQALKRLFSNFLYFSGK